MGADGADAAAVHDDDAVGVLNRGHALGNDNFSGIRDELAEALADQRVGPGVHSGGGIVQDQDLGLLQQGPGDAEPLLLAAGDVAAALLNPGVVLVGELLDELVGLGQTAGLIHLFVGGVGVAPAEIVLDGAGEQHVLLQHHGHVVAEGFQVIASHVYAADPDRAFRHVVEPWDQLHQGALGRARTAQDADEFAGTDVEIHMLQGVALGGPGVLVADAVKIDGAVLHFLDRILGAGQAALFLQHLDDTLGGLHGHGDDHEHHGEHHQAHEDLEAVCNDGRHLADVDLQALAGYDGVGAEAQDEDHAGVHAELHHGVVDGHDALGTGEVPANVLGGDAELLFLIVFADVALDHTHGLYVLLHRVVEGVVLAEHPAENGGGLADHQSQADAQQRDRHQEDHGQAAAHGKAHDEGEDQHQRPADGHADDHHEGHLHVHDIGGHPGHQTGDGELVDVFKRIVLNVVEHILPQIPCKAGGGCGAGVAGRHAKNQRQHGHDNQLRAVSNDDVHAAAGLHLVDEIGDYKRDDTFQDDLAYHQDRR